MFYISNDGDLIPFDFSPEEEITQEETFHSIRSMQVRSNQPDYSQKHHQIRDIPLNSYTLGE